MIFLFIINVQYGWCNLNHYSQHEIALMDCVWLGLNYSVVFNVINVPLLISLVPSSADLVCWRGFIYPYKVSVTHVHREALSLHSVKGTLTEWRHLLKGCGGSQSQREDCELCSVELSAFVLCTAVVLGSFRLGGMCVYVLVGICI